MAHENIKNLKLSILKRQKVDAIFILLYNYTRVYIVTNCKFQAAESIVTDNWRKQVASASQIFSRYYILIHSFIWT